VYACVYVCMHIYFICMTVCMHACVCMCGGPDVWLHGCMHVGLLAGLYVWVCMYVMRCLYCNVLLFVCVGCVSVANMCV